jgi:pyruvate/2-oxoglutarate dehydrogenase complex dihydrolipoamide acyltransferase (E2) component
VVARVREMMPDVRAARRGKVATLRYRERSARITDAGSTWWVKFAGEGPQMAMLAVERHDERTARNVAKTIAGAFDARWSRPD